MTLLKLGWGTGQCYQMTYELGAIHIIRDTRGGCTGKKCHVLFEWPLITEAGTGKCHQMKHEWVGSKIGPKSVTYNLNGPLMQVLFKIVIYVIYVI